MKAAILWRAVPCGIFLTQSRKKQKSRKVLVISILQFCETFAILREKNPAVGVSGQKFYVACRTGRLPWRFMKKSAQGITFAETSPPDKYA